MKAWVFRSKGQPSKVLNLESDFPRPTPSGDYVLVKVNAVSLNVSTLLSADTSIPLD
jgi:NADPH:quinone reductase-like Zn-dependent oxidoreductase